MKKKLVRVVSAEVVRDHLVLIAFSDGESRSVDLGPFLRGPMFEEIRTRPEAFKALKVDPELGTIIWPNGADVDPDVLYGSAEPAWRSTSDT
jgi:hypothetical protein